MSKETEKCNNQPASERSCPDPSGSAEVLQEILEIMQEYDRQLEVDGYVDTPGGLEHMGDVWRLLRRWKQQIQPNNEDRRAP